MESEVVLFEKQLLLDLDAVLDAVLHDLTHPVYGCHLVLEPAAQPVIHVAVRLLRLALRLLDDRDALLFDQLYPCAQSHLWKTILYKLQHLFGIKLRSTGRGVRKRLSMVGFPV